jgi:hypothetical protein
MNKKNLLTRLIVVFVVLFLMSFAAASFFYFKGSAVAPLSLKDDSPAKTAGVPEAPEESLSKDFNSQGYAVVTASSSDDSQAFDLCSSTFKDFASLKVGDCYADSVVKSFTSNGYGEPGGNGVVFVQRNAEYFAYMHGNYTCLDRALMDDAEVVRYTGSVCFVPDDDSNLPRFAGDKYEQSFCFADSDTKNSEEIFCGKEKSGRASVWLSEYMYSYRFSNSHNTALKWSAKIDKPMPGVKIGGKMSGMTVKSFFDEDSEKQINFSGQSRITGDYSYQDKGEFDGGWACFNNLDVASEAVMPKFPGDKSGKSDFCIPNSDLLQKELISVATSGRATIDIENFDLIYCQCGAWSNADLVDVIAVEKK